MGRGMKVTYDGDEAAAKDALDRELAGVDEAAAGAEEVAEQIAEDELTPEEYTNELRRLELQALRGLRMLRSATDQAADLSISASEALAPKGVRSPIQEFLGLGTGTGLPEKRMLLASLLRRIADRYDQGYELDEQSIKTSV